MIIEIIEMLEILEIIGLEFYDRMLEALFDNNSWATEVFSGKKQLDVTLNKLILIPSKVVFVLLCRVKHF